MYRVKNKRIIRHLARQSFLANRTRNRMAVLAIVLTTVLFCALFTAIVSVNYSVEQQTMRQVGGYAHGGFKGLTREQEQILKEHPLVREHGSNQMLTYLEDGVFSKHRAEVRYSDEVGAKMFFSEPTVGGMPEEYLEVATDTAVLDLLGVPHEIGASVTIPFRFHEETVERTFTLCGYWEADDAMPVSQIWLSLEFVDEVLANVEPDRRMETADAGSWNLNLCFASSRNIEENLRTIAEDNGYQTEDPGADNYLRVGVNWAYTSTHSNSGEAALNLLAAVFVLLLIILVGYLIIYNIFQISVAGDIRFYGLLKTIGTTGRQLKRMIRYQAMRLCLIGIPTGLLLGYLAGRATTALVVSAMYQQRVFHTLNPWIFAGSACFSILTVLLSVRKPAKMAALVSPIEAIRYADADVRLKKRSRRRRMGSLAWQMAVAGLARNRKKTTFVILSLSLSVVLLHAACSVAAGFDLNKFVSKRSSTDYLIAHADYFQDRFGAQSQAVSETLQDAVEAQDGIEKSGRIWRGTGITMAKMTKAQYMKVLSSMQIQTLDDSVRSMAEEEEGDFAVGMYGLEPFPFESLRFVGKSVSWEEFDTDHALIQILKEDDYGNPQMEKASFQVGDQVSLLIVDEYRYVGTDLEPEVEILKSHRETYTIIASAILPSSLTVRRYGNAEFAMAAGRMKEELGTEAAVMSYVVDMKEDSKGGLEDFLKNYTEQVEPDFDFESRAGYVEKFDSLRQMFLLIGTSASAIVALVGILNFMNAIVTGIRSRRRELAMLQSIGMTGSQLKKMLICEGCAYSVIAFLAAFLLNLLMHALILKQLEHLLWFFLARFIWYPAFGMLAVFLVMGALIPILAYRSVERVSIVERLRMGE